MTKGSPKQALVTKSEKSSRQTGAHTQAKHRHREEVINTYLAILLTRHGVNAEAETIHHSGEARPDVMFTMGGLRVTVEGKFGDVPDAETVVLGDANQRIATGICHIAVALVYPKTLRTGVHCLAGINPIGFTPALSDCLGNRADRVGGGNPFRNSGLAAPCS